ncbi:PspA/IM30 family protein [Alicyclobacillus dauci]|uniref:Phage shock protein A (PspA) family protein n=1 Tax=Alicyclobacillus dauci TaxID=1475485 RepID=A0ABY6Z6J7_9BACL|nr:hypothetical protein [Alicyclobacillus dauci]WAH37655.1 hypothetical protein NZD86_03755 [Alicyclobacillus dauci]
MSLFRKLRNAAQQTGKRESGDDNAERAINIYIEAASERLRSFHTEVQRVQAQTITLRRKISELDDFIRHDHDLAKSSLAAGNETEAIKYLEAERRERDRQDDLRSQLALSEKTATQLESLYTKLADRLDRAKAARADLVARRDRAQVQIDAFASLSDVDVHNPLRDFERLELDVIREEARAEAEYEVYHSPRDPVSAAIADLQRELDTSSNDGGKDNRDSR